MKYLVYNRVRQLFLVAVLLAHPSLTFNQTQPPYRPNASAGISQLVETRAGRIACWGVVINLKGTRFKKRIKAEELDIREAKHGRDIKEIMTWSVDQFGKRLVIKFKPGQGDFGTGNRVEVRINRSALVELHLSENDFFQWTIDTDLR